MLDLTLILDLGEGHWVQPGTWPSPFNLSHGHGHSRGHTHAGYRHSAYSYTHHRHL